MNYLERVDKLRKLPGFATNKMHNGFTFKEFLDAEYYVYGCSYDFYIHTEITFYKNSRYYDEKPIVVSFEQFFNACSKELQKTILFNLELFQ